MLIPLRSNWTILGLTLALLVGVWLQLSFDEDLQQIQQWKTETMLHVKPSDLTILVEGADKMHQLKQLEVDLNPLLRTEEASWKTVEQQLRLIGKSAVTLEHLSLFYDRETPDLDWWRLFHVFPHLRVLRIKGLTLSSANASMGNMEDLEELYLIDCGLERFDETQYFPKLRILDLRRNQLADLWQNLDAYPNLQELYLNDNRIKKIKYLSHYHQVRKVSLAWNRVGEGYNEFTYWDDNKKAGNLCELDLQGNKLKTIPAVLTRLPNLRILDLSHNKLRGELSQLDGVHSLELLYLTNNYNLDTPVVLKSLPNLQQVIY